MERAFAFGQEGNKDVYIPVSEVIRDCEQYELHDLGSEQVAASATEYLAVYATIPTLKMRGLFVNITGDGTASIGIDFAVALDGNGVPIWCRRLTALETSLTKTSGNGGWVFIPIPKDEWGMYLRVWVTETGTSNTVTIAAQVGGRP